MLLNKGLVSVLACFSVKCFEGTSGTLLQGAAHISKQGLLYLGSRDVKGWCKFIAVLVDTVAISTLRQYTPRKGARGMKVVEEYLWYRPSCMCKSETFYCIFTRVSVTFLQVACGRPCGAGCGASSISHHDGLCRMLAGLYPLHRTFHRISLLHCVQGKHSPMRLPAAVEDFLKNEGIPFKKAQPGALEVSV